MIASTHNTEGKYVAFIEIANGCIKLCLSDTKVEMADMVDKEIEMGNRLEESQKVREVAVFENRINMSFKVDKVFELFGFIHEETANKLKSSVYEKMLKFSIENLDLLYCTEGMALRVTPVRRVLFEKEK